MAPGSDLVAAASTLQGKVAFLKRRTTLAAMHRQEVRVFAAGPVQCMPWAGMLDEHEGEGCSCIKAQA